MNKTIKRTFISGLLLVALGLSAEGRGHYNSEEHLKRMTKHLNLDKDQVSKIEAINKASEPNKKKLSEQITKTQKELRELMTADEMDTKKIRGKMEEMSKLKVDKKMIWVEDRAKIRAVLTPEQKKKQKELMTKAHQKMKDKKKNWDKKKKRD